MSDINFETAKEINYDAIEGAIPEGISAGALLAQFSKLAKAKTGNVAKDNMNLIGGIIGCAIATGLELASPTGSKASAAVAAIASGSVLLATRKVVENAPQAVPVAGAALALTAYVGMSAGRITADYFPGNISLDD